MGWLMGAGVRIHVNFIVCQFEGPSRRSSVNLVALYLHCTWEIDNELDTWISISIACGSEDDPRRENGRLTLMGVGEKRERVESTSVLR